MKSTSLLVIITLLIYFLASCQPKKVVKEDKEVPKDSLVTQIPIQEEVSVPNKGTNMAGTIEVGKCGEIALGGLMKDISSTYNQKSRVEEYEGGDTGTVYQYFDGNSLLFEIVPNGEQISNIEIFTPKFTTKTGFGVGSTIKDFIVKYPRYRLWYTYVSDMFVLETDELENIQFKINPKDHIGKGELAKSDTDELKLSDFKSDAKILSVRIF